MRWTEGKADAQAQDKGKHRGQKDPPWRGGDQDRRPIEREAMGDGYMPGLERADRAQRQADEDNGKSRQRRWRVSFQGVLGTGAQCQPFRHLGLRRTKTTEGRAIQDGEYDQRFWDVLSGS